MDPLKKLAEKNRKHAEIKRRERLETLGHIPIVLVSLAAYFSIFAFFSMDNYDPVEFPLWGLSKQVWFFAIVLSGGIGSICFIGSLSYLIWLHIFAHKLEIKVSFFRISMISAVSLGISFLFLLLGKYLDSVIHDNANEIANFMRFGLREIPGPIEFALNLFIIFISIVLLQIAMFIASLPFKASKHAREFKANKKLNS